LSKCGSNSLKHFLLYFRGWTIQRWKVLLNKTDKRATATTLRPAQPAMGMISSITPISILSMYIVHYFCTLVHQWIWLIIALSSNMWISQHNNTYQNNYQGSVLIWCRVLNVCSQYGSWFRHIKSCLTHSKVAFYFINLTKLWFPSRSS